MFAYWHSKYCATSLAQFHYGNSSVSFNIFNMSWIGIGFFGFMLPTGHVSEGGWVAGCRHLGMISPGERLKKIIPRNGSLA